MIPYPPEISFGSTKSRADVQAEVAQAQKDDSPDPGMQCISPIAAAGKSLSRAEIINQIVKAEPAIYSGN